MDALSAVVNKQRIIVNQRHEETSDGRCDGQQQMKKTRRGGQLARVFIYFYSMWKFNSPYIDFTRYLNKKHSKTTAPNKIIVLICWFAVIVAMIIAFIKFI